MYFTNIWLQFYSIYIYIYTQINVIHFYHVRQDDPQFIGLILFFDWINNQVEDNLINEGEVQVLFPEIILIIRD